jgi:hypothetical protein
VIDRRAFLDTLAGGLLAAPLAVQAQQSQKGWRIGYLSVASDVEPYKPVRKTRKPPTGRGSPVTPSERMRYRALARSSGGMFLSLSD